MNDSTPQRTPETELEPATPPADELFAAAEPQFRTVSLPGHRAGIRIERIFWDSLTDISAGLGIRRSALVGNIVARARAGELNVASALRSYVAMVHRAENARLKSALAPASLVKLQQLAPLPSFALTRQKRLVSANAEFLQFLRAIAADPTRAVTPEVAQLSLDRPIEEVFEHLRQDGAWLRCQLTIRIDARQRRATCKIVAVPPAPSQAVVGYVLAD